VRREVERPLVIAEGMGSSVRSLGRSCLPLPGASPTCGSTFHKHSCGEATELSAGMPTNLAYSLEDCSSTALETGRDRMCGLFEGSILLEELGHVPHVEGAGEEEPLTIVTVFFLQLEELGGFFDSLAQGF
jgi:hypothetical protein